MTVAGKRVLVTGAGGFIGSHLCELLVEQGAEVTAFLHYNCRSDIGNLRFASPDKLRAMRLVFGDIADGFAVDEAVRGKDIVLHLAALIAIPHSYTNPYSYV